MALASMLYLHGASTNMRNSVYRAASILVWVQALGAVLPASYPMRQSIITTNPLELQAGVWLACGIHPCSATPAAATPVQRPFHLHRHAHSCCCCQCTTIMYGSHAPHTPTFKRWQLLQRRLMGAGHGELLLPAATPNPPKLQRCHTSSALGVSIGRLRWAGTLIMCIKEL